MNRKEIPMAILIKMIMMALVETPALLDLINKLFSQKRTVPTEQELAELVTAEAERRAADKDFDSTKTMSI